MKSKSQAVSPSKPREVRAVILKEHAQLRARLAQLSALLKLEQREGHPNAVDELRREFRALSEFFAEHLALEDKLLPPLLRDDYAWGEVRTQAMKEHHAEQREELAKLRSMLDPPASERETVFAALERFVAELELDMHYEEEGLLSPAILGDNIVSVESGG